MNGFDVVYNGEHSIQIGGKNTWTDWHLIPSTRPLVNPPEVKTKYLDIPGANGSIDLTEILTGFPNYENRTGSWEFIVVNGHKQVTPSISQGALQTHSGVNLTTESLATLETIAYYRPEVYTPNHGKSHWDVLYSEIMNYLHGKKYNVILNDDKGFVYNGRLAVNQWKSDKNWSTITIDYNLAPFKKERFDSLSPWEWNPFDFRTGIIRDYRGMTVNGTLVLDIIPREEPIIPRILAYGSVGVLISGQFHQLPVGRWEENPELLITQQNHTLSFKGSGKVSVDYRGGSL